MSTVATTKKKNAKKTQSRFERLWQKANRQKKENEVLKTSLDELVQRFQKEVIPYEKALAESRKPLAIRLLGLGQRKSMTQWERRTLHSWIMEIFEDLGEFGLIDEDLMNHMARYDAFRMGIELEDGEAPYEELGNILRQQQEEERVLREEASRRYQEQTQKERDDMLKRGQADIDRKLDKALGPRPDMTQSKTGDLWEDDLSEAVSKEQVEYDKKREQLRAEMMNELQEDISLVFDNDEDEDLEDLLDFDLDEFLDEHAEKFFHERAPGSDAAAKKAEDPLSSDTFQRLFRATAAKLHPDREQDPTLRDKKQNLMAGLLKARKRGDIITIIDLYKTWVDDTSTLSKSDEKALHSALEQWVYTLEAEADEIITESPMHNHVFHEYYSRSKRTVDRALKERVATLDRAVESSQMLSVSITSLKSLKPWLEDRFERERWSLGYF